MVIEKVVTKVIKVIFKKFIAWASYVLFKSSFSSHML